MTAAVYELDSGYGPNMAHGHGICAIDVPAGWVVERCTVEPRAACGRTFVTTAISTDRPLTLIRMGI
ncbi:hypothetical protein ACFVUS_07235 [Nocardia sp. NPDC058058]|uniref:hypothetical protein n=1 Tax=Nocardia sp. NPDC058058 TaxID=3346317 RepID=UPI0036D9FCE5